MISRLHVHVYCSATMVGWIQCQNSKGRGPMSNFVSVKNFEIFFKFCIVKFNFFILYLKFLISLLQEFISWLSSVSPEDSVLVCWDDEVTLSKLFCTC